MYPGMSVVSSGFLPLIGGTIEPECVPDRLITDNPWQVNHSVPWLVGVNSKEALFLLICECSLNCLNNSKTNYEK